MDGTIIDTSHLWRQATYALIGNKNVTVELEHKHVLEKRLHGLNMSQACIFIKEYFSITDSVEQLMIEKTALACALYKQGIMFIEGFEQFHSQVAPVYKTGIATNADDATLALSVQTLKLDRFFGDHIYNISHVHNKGKPDPAIYLHVARQLDVHPDQCIAIEDSAHGIASAQRAGMFCIGINTSGNLDQVKAADLIIDKYADLDRARLQNLRKSQKVAKKL